MEDFKRNTLKYDGPFMGKPRMTQRDKWVGRSCVQRYFSFKKSITLIAFRQRFVLSNCFKILFVVEIPKSWSKKKKDIHRGKDHKQKPDVDNLVKAVMDALMKEDKEVYSVQMAKIWGDKPQIIIKNCMKWNIQSMLTT